MTMHTHLSGPDSAQHAGLAVRDTVVTLCVFFLRVQRESGKPFDDPAEGLGQIDQNPPRRALKSEETSQGRAV